MGSDTKKVIQSDKLKAINELPVGRRGVVRLLRGGDDFNHRMAVLGFTPGAEVMVVQNYGHGPILVAVRDTHIALGRGESFKVLVEVV